MTDGDLVSLGAELRRFREALEVSGSEVARALGWSQSKVSRVETGRFGASLSEIATLLDYYGVPEEVRAELLARTARREGLAGAWVVRAGGPRRRQGELGAIEQRVSRLRQYQCMVVPGLLQSPRYAAGVASKGRFGDPIGVAARRAERQSAFHARHDVRYQLVLDARALMRWPGGPDVMAEQLERLLSLPANVDLRILPPSGPCDVVAMGSFLLYEFDQATPAVVLVEGQTADFYLSSPTDVQAHAEVFTRLRAASFDDVGTRAYLEDAGRALRAGADREE